MVKDTDFGGRPPGLNPSSATRPTAEGTLSLRLPSVKWINDNNSTHSREAGMS